VVDASVLLPLPLLSFLRSSFFSSADQVARMTEEIVR